MHSQKEATIAFAAKACRESRISSDYTRKAPTRC